MDEKMTWLQTWRHIVEGEFSGGVKFLEQPQSLGQETRPPENSNLNKLCYLSFHLLFVYHSLPQITMSWAEILD